MHTGSAESCKQCNVAAESTSATGIFWVFTTEIADKDCGLDLSSLFFIQHRQVQLRVDPPCILVNVAVATWLGSGVKQSPPT